MDNFSQDLDDLPGNEDEAEWLEAVGESSGTAHYYHERTAEVWREQSQFDEWLNP